ncbi:hypothetical protein [Pseudomonas sp. Sample_21]|uniref:hypothetical protein n=1 Tax=Pseudomonas sp. Sample_21 TaxID=2448265 RepID=UPI001031F1ED|nr:hypothetical protein [Pseudomonas sp. Sample_21]
MTLQVALPGHMGGDRTYDTGELTDALPGDSAFSVGNCTADRSLVTLRSNTREYGAQAKPKLLTKF